MSRLRFCSNLRKSLYTLSNQFQSHFHRERSFHSRSFLHFYFFEGLPFLLFFHSTPLVNPYRLADSAEYTALSGDTDGISNKVLGFRYALLHRPARLVTAKTVTAMSSNLAYPRSCFFYLTLDIISFLDEAECKVSMRGFHIHADSV